jgi:tRNA(Ile)-lysidine synthetase-like protein
MFSLNSTEKVFSEAIVQYLSEDSKVLVAFSGGCDSLALLVLCSKVLGNKRTVPVYVNHNIRQKAELEKEISLNKDNCKRLGLDLVVRTLDPGQVEKLSQTRKGGTEDAARILRYEVLEQERQKNNCSFILTAHHKDDQIETVVMHLRSGSPMTSLRGISVFDEKRHLLRPLLNYSRNDLEDYLRTLGFTWSIDSTNEDESYRRNEVRSTVIPQVKKLWPDFEIEVISLQSQAKDAFEKTELADANDNSIGLKELRKKDLTGRALSLYAMWDSIFENKDLPMMLLDRVLDAVSEDKDCSVGSNLAVFHIYHGRLYLEDPAQNKEFEQFSQVVDAHEKQTICLPGNMKLVIGSDGDDPLALRMNPDKFAGQTKIRFAKEGDFIRLKDGKKMVLRLLQDMKIPPHLRTRVPVIEDKKEICAVFGSLFGGKDRICVKFRTSLAPNDFPLYIVTKG